MLTDELFFVISDHRLFIYIGCLAGCTAIVHRSDGVFTKQYLGQYLLIIDNTIL